MSTWLTMGGPAATAKELNQDERGHRTYSITLPVETDELTAGSEAGPARVFFTPGLPTPGTSYQLGGDIDVWAYCLPTRRIYAAPGQHGPKKFWLVDCLFTTKPIERKLIVNQQDPMIEPNRISGGFNRFTEEAVYDRFGERIANSAHELYRGPQNEWDMARPTVRIAQNVPLLGIDTFAPMINNVNSVNLWGFPPRFIKLQNVTYTEKFHRFSSFWERVLDFEIWARKDEDGNWISGWDRDLLDEGTKAMRGEWVNQGSASSPNWQWVLIGSPRRFNPADFVRFTDTNGNMCRVVLDGAGRPWVPTTPTSDQTTACGQCPGGSPLIWVLGGFNGTFAGGVDSQLNGLELAHTTGCNWSGTQVLSTGVSVAVTLDFGVTTGSTWTLSVPLAGLQRWDMVGGDWQCLSDNQMIAVIGNAPESPSTLTLSPGTTPGNQPGKIHVEKYDEADFYLLQVPAVIGP